MSEYCHEEKMVLKLLRGEWVYLDLAKSLGISKQGAINLTARVCRVMFMNGRLRLGHTIEGVGGKTVIKEAFTKSGN